MMNFLKELTSGKKTYLAALAIAVCVFLQWANVVEIPNELWALLGAGGLVGLRAGVDKTNGK